MVLTAPVLNAPLSSNGSLIFSYITDPYITYVSGFLTLYDETKSSTPNPIQVNLNGCEISEGCIEVSGLKTNVTYACVLVLINTTGERVASNTVKGVLTVTPDVFVLSNNVSFNQDFTQTTVNIKTGLFTGNKINLVVYNNNTDTFDVYSYSPNDSNVSPQSDTTNFSPETKYGLTINVQKHNYYTVWGTIGDSANESAVSNTFSFFPSNIPPEPTLSAALSGLTKSVNLQLSLNGFQVTDDTYTVIYAKTDSSDWVSVKTLIANQLAGAQSLNVLIDSLENNTGYTFAARTFTSDYSSKAPDEFTSDDLDKYSAKAATATVITVETLGFNYLSQANDTFAIYLGGAGSLYNTSAQVNVYATINSVSKLIGKTDTINYASGSFNGYALHGTLFDTSEIETGSELKCELTLTQTIQDDILPYWLNDNYTHDSQDYSIIKSNKITTGTYIQTASKVTNLEALFKNIDGEIYIDASWNLPSAVEKQNITACNFSINYQDSITGNLYPYVSFSLPILFGVIPTTYSLKTTPYYKYAPINVSVSLTNIAGNSGNEYSNVFDNTTSQVESYPISGLSASNSSLGVVDFAFDNTSDVLLRDLLYTVSLIRDNTTLATTSFTNPSSTVITGNFTGITDGSAVLSVSKTFILFGQAVSYSATTNVSTAGSDFPITGLSASNPSLGVVQFSFNNTSDQLMSSLYYVVELLNGSTVVATTSFTNPSDAVITNTFTGISYTGSATISVTKTYTMFNVPLTFTSTNSITIVGAPIIQNVSFVHTTQSTVSFEVVSLSNLTGAMIIAFPIDITQVDLFKNLTIPTPVNNIYSFVVSLNYLLDKDFPSYVIYTANTIANAHALENL